MTEQLAAESPQRAQPSHGSGLSHGFAVFAGVIMILSGAYQGVAGLVALFENEFYVATRNYLFQFDATTWGLIHLLLGALVVLAGIAVLSGQTWARVVGIVLVAISGLGSFMFVPYYPVWGMLIIALNVVVIWALAVDRPDAR